MTTRPIDAKPLSERYRISGHPQLKSGRSPGTTIAPESNAPDRERGAEKSTNCSLDRPS
jgi:hypothetical protein